MAERRIQLTKARKLVGYTQESLAEALQVERTTVHRWESGRTEPLPYLRPRLAALLGITPKELDGLLSPKSAAVRTEPGSTTTRRVAVEHELVADISGRDAASLAQVQTTHAMDHRIASMIDIATRNTLRRWSTGLDNAIARVNATGILAKLSDQSQSGHVVAVLSGDDEVRRLYLTAVTARVCAVNWDQASAFVQAPTTFPLAPISAERFAREAVNPADAGARWCSARMLQELSPVIGG